MAAGPAKVGENSPKFDDVTKVVASGGEAAAAFWEVRKRLLTNIADSVTIEGHFLSFPVIVRNIEFSWVDLKVVCLFALLGHFTKL